nr:6-phosphogluconolactonase [Chryseobacterium sp. CH1]
MTDETLLSQVPVDKNQIFPMYTDGILPEDYAKTYEQNIRNVLGDEGCI